MASSAFTPKAVWAWAMYDWANSAYILTVVTAVLPAYFSGVVVPAGGVRLLGQMLAGATLWGLLVGLADLAVFLVAPLLGAAADLTGGKRFCLGAFALAGCLGAVLLSRGGPGDVLWTAGFFLLAQMGFAGANVFYDAFLPTLAPAREHDRISALGFALGYVGGGLQFLVGLLLVQGHAALGLTTDAAARWAMALAGLWWAVFSLPALLTLRDAPPAGPRPAAAEVLRQALAAARGTLATLGSGGSTGRFLLAFLCYNDAIQTIIAMATIYGKEELGLPLAVLMQTLLLIQAVAFGGSLLFARLAGRVGTRGALLTTLAVWAGVMLYALRMRTAGEFMAVGAVIGLVMGGTQALSRSCFAAMVPQGREAQYFGYYSVVGKLSAVAGPFLFAAALHAWGSARLAILPLLVMLLAGMALLWSSRE